MGGVPGSIPPSVRPYAIYHTTTSGRQHTSICNTVAVTASGQMLCYVASRMYVVFGRHTIFPLPIHTHPFSCKMLLRTHYVEHRTDGGTDRPLASLSLHGSLDGRTAPIDRGRRGRRGRGLWDRRGRGRRRGWNGQEDRLSVPKKGGIRRCGRRRGTKRVPVGPGSPLFPSSRQGLKSLVSGHYTVHNTCKSARVESVPVQSGILCVWVRVLVPIHST